MKFLQQILALIAIFRCLPAFAETEPNTIIRTITGTRTEKNVNEIPSSITVFDLENSRQTGVLELKDLMQYEPGVSVFDPREINYRSSGGVRGSTSTGNVNIRGLSNNRILMQQDGVRLPSGFYAVGYDYSNGNVVDYYSLKTIDVLKGPASVLYGSDALGGVVSFQSLKAEDLLKSDEMFKIETPFDYNGSNNGVSEAFRIANNDVENGIAYVMVISSTESEEVTPNEAEDQYVNDANIKTKAIYLNIDRKLNESNKISFLFDKYLKNTKVVRADGNLASGYLSQHSSVDINKNRYVISWDYSSMDENTFFESVKAKAFYQKHHTADLWEEIQDVPSLSSRPVTSDYNLFDQSYGVDFQFGSSINNHLITYGIDYSLTENQYHQDKYTSTYGVIDQRYNGSKIMNYYNGTFYPIKRSPDTDTIRLGIYVQDEIEYENFDLIAGIRFDGYKLDASADSIYLDYCSTGSNGCPVADFDTSHVSPKIGLTYPLNNEMEIWGQYSRGFRAPSWWEFQASQVNHTARPAYQTIPNSDLKEETSNSYEIGFRGDYQKYNFELTGYYNTYNNFIEEGVNKGIICIDIEKDLSEVSCKNSSEDIVEVTTYQTDNVKEAMIWGIEFSHEYKFNPSKSGFSLLGSAGYTYGENKNDNTPLNKIDPFKIVSGIKYKSDKNKLSGELISTYVGRIRRKDSETGFWPKSYTSFDLLSKYQYSKSLNISMGIYNLFNKTYYKSTNISSGQSDLGIEQFSEPGRHARVGIRYIF